jgi:enoyl-CoA hydratase/carnithine racemase
MLTGCVFDAAEAEKIGLVLDVVDGTELLAAAVAKAREIAGNSPLAVWMTKETMWQTVDAPSLRHALDIENRTQVMCTATGDLASSFAAFAEDGTSRWHPL